MATAGPRSEIAADPGRECGPPGSGAADHPGAFLTGRHPSERPTGLAQGQVRLTLTLIHY